MCQLQLLCGESQALPEIDSLLSIARRAKTTGGLLRPAALHWLQHQWPSRRSPTRRFCLTKKVQQPVEARKRHYSISN